MPATKQRQSIVLVFTGNHERSARDQNPVNVGFFSYLIACAAYLVLTTLLLVSWRGRALVLSLDRSVPMPFHRFALARFTDDPAETRAWFHPRAGARVCDTDGPKRCSQRPCTP